jgi:hypothetical protein
MKTKFQFLAIFAVAAALFLSGCGKEGPPGQDGVDGNANVIASGWYSPTVWAGQTGDWYFGVSSTAITQDIVESGVILAYCSLPGDIYDAPVRPMPCWAINANWDFLIPDYGQIEFTSDALYVPGTDNYYFRFILIPASNFLKSSEGKEAAVAELRKMSYHEVCTKYGIKE